MNPLAVEPVDVTFSETAPTPVAGTRLDEISHLDCSS